MSSEGARALSERINSDERFRARLEAAATAEDKGRIVTEAGYDVSQDDLSTIGNLAGTIKLSEEDLDSVAGGVGEPERPPDQPPPWWPNAPRG